MKRTNVQKIMVAGDQTQEAPSGIIWLNKKYRENPDSDHIALASTIAEWAKENLIGTYKIVKVCWQKGSSISNSNYPKRYGLKFENERDMVLFELFWN